MKKASIPVAIVVAAIVLGGSFMWVQANKQASIEKQVQWELEQEAKELDYQKEQDRLKRLDEENDEEFTKQMECQDMLSDLRRRWNNVVGISYSSIWNECMVKYTDEDGETQEGRLSGMQDN